MEINNEGHLNVLKMQNPKPKGIFVALGKLNMLYYNIFIIIFLYIILYIFIPKFQCYARESEPQVQGHFDSFGKTT